MTDKSLPKPAARASALAKMVWLSCAVLLLSCGRESTVGDGNASGTDTGGTPGGEGGAGGDELGVEGGDRPSAGSGALTEPGAVLHSTNGAAGRVACGVIGCCFVNFDRRIVCGGDEPHAFDGSFVKLDMSYAGVVSALDTEGRAYTWSAVPSDRPVELPLGAGLRDLALAESSAATCVLDAEGYQHCNEPDWPEPSSPWSLADSYGGGYFLDTTGYLDVPFPLEGFLPPRMAGPYRRADLGFEEGCGALLDGGLECFRLVGDKLEFSIITRPRDLRAALRGRRPRLRGQRHRQAQVLGDVLQLSGMSEPRILRPRPGRGLCRRGSRTLRGLCCPAHGRGRLHHTQGRLRFSIPSLHRREPSEAGCARAVRRGAPV